MKIEHTTYDAAHNIQTRRPSTATEKVKHFFGIGSQKKNNDPEIKRVHFDLRSTTMKDGHGEMQAMGCSTHVPLYGWATGKLKARRSSYQVLGDDKLPNKITKKRDVQRPVKGNKSTPAQSELKMVHHERLNHAPNKSLDLSGYGTRPAPQPLPNSVPTRRKKKSESNVSFGNINTNHPLSKRHGHDAESEFHKKAVIYQSPTYRSHKQRQAIIDDQDSATTSTESFFCSGELTSIDNSQPQVSPNSDRTSPWLLNNQANETCRLCHIRTAAGARGICIDCENTYCCPQPDVFDDSHEIKPTPPLKVRSENVGEGVKRKQTFPQSPPPIPPLKENELRKLKIIDVGAKTAVPSQPIRHHSSRRAVLGNVEPTLRNLGGKPTLIPASSNRHPSQRGSRGRVSRMGSARKVISKSSKWQEEEIRKAYEQAAAVEIEDPEYGSSTYESLVSGPEDSNGDDDDRTMLLGGKKGLKKSDSFYVFYDAMLRDLGVATPKGKKAARRYDEL